MHCSRQNIFSSLATEVKASTLEWQITGEVCFSHIIHQLNYRVGLMRRSLGFNVFTYNKGHKVVSDYQYLQQKSLWRSEANGYHLHISSFWMKLTKEATLKDEMWNLTLQLHILNLGLIHTLPN